MVVRGLGSCLLLVLCAVVLPSSRSYATSGPVSQANALQRIAAYCGSTGGNLLCNPGFEQPVPSYEGGSPLPPSGPNWLAFAPDYHHPGGRGVLRQVAVPRHSGRTSASVRVWKHGTGAYYYQDVPSLPPGASYYLSFWVFPATATPGEQEVELITGWDRGRGTVTGLTAVAFSGRGTVLDAWDRHVAGPALRPGAWHRVTLMADTCARTVQMVIDGVYVEETAPGVVPRVGGATVLVGQGAGLAPSTSQYYYDAFRLVPTRCLGLAA